MLIVDNHLVTILAQYAIMDMPCTIMELIRIATVN